MHDVAETLDIHELYDFHGLWHAHLAQIGRSEVLAVTDNEAMDAAFELTKLEGIIPAIESAHALGALNKKQFNADDVIVLCLSGRGDKDMETYINYRNR